MTSLIAIYYFQQSVFNSISLMTVIMKHRFILKMTFKLCSHSAHCLSYVCYTVIHFVNFRHMLNFRRTLKFRRTLNFICTLYIYIYLSCSYIGFIVYCISCITNIYYWFLVFVCFSLLKIWKSKPKRKIYVYIWIF